MQSSVSGEEQRPSKQLLSVNTDKPPGMIDRLNSPLLANKTSAVEEKKAFGSHTIGPEPGLSGSEIENLLERRTVLQLLLGNPNKGKTEKKEKMPLRDESTQEHTDRALSEQILMVKIKSEPCDDLHPHATGTHLSHEAPGAPLLRDGPSHAEKCTCLTNIRGLETRAWLTSGFFFLKEWSAESIAETKSGQSPG